MAVRLTSSRVATSFKELPYSETKNILDTYWFVYMQALRESGLAIRLPYPLGHMAVNKAKSNSPPLDWNYYNKTGEKRFHKNRHSDGWYGFFNWYKGIHIPQKSLFKFVPSRANKKLLSTEITELDGLYKYDMEKSKRRNER